MNLFILDRNPRLAAMQLCDKHVHNQIKETAQILCSVAYLLLDEMLALKVEYDMLPVEKQREMFPIHFNTRNWSDIQRLQSQIPCRPTHLTHPIVLWVAKNRTNWNWTVSHAQFLGEEYIDRFDRIHASTEAIHWCYYKGPKPIGTPSLEFIQIVSEQYKQENAVLAYQDYYWNEKRSFAKWAKGRRPPAWWQDRLRKEAASGKLKFGGSPT